MINRMFEWMRDNNIGEDMIYFAQYRDDKSPYQRLANKFDIGILASSDIIGKATLVFLQLYMDNDLNKLKDLIVKATRRIDIERTDDRDFVKFMKAFGDNIEQIYVTNIDETIYVPKYIAVRDMTRQILVWDRQMIEKNMDEIDVYSIDDVYELIRRNI